MILVLSLLLILGCMAGLPCLIYVCVKLGRYAYLQANLTFSERNCSDGHKESGKEASESLRGEESR